MTATAARGQRPASSWLRRIFGALDPVLLSCSSLLSLISLLMLWGGRGTFGTKCLVVQLGATVVGFACMVVLANIDYRWLAEKLSPLFFAVSVGLLLLLLFRGTGAGTNKSWLYFRFLPFGIQPTELIKTALAISFAYHLSRVRSRLNHPLSVLGLAVHAGVIVGLIVLTGDLGVALIFVCFLLLMLFCAGLSLWYFGGGAVVFGALSPLLWKHLNTYQKQRILVGFRPESDPTGYGRQPLLSRDAIMAGGFFGDGVGGGRVYASLYASHTDFMYATVCEKLGFFGGILVLALLVVFIIRAFSIAARADHEIGAYLCVGLSCCLAVQTIVNIGMCLAVLPVVGITLPFISYGGSSILGVYLMAGMLHSVSAHRGRYSGLWR